MQTWLLQFHHFHFLFCLLIKNYSVSWLGGDDDKKMYCNCLEVIFSRDPGSLSSWVSYYFLPPGFYISSALTFLSCVFVRVND